MNVWLFNFAEREGERNVNTQNNVHLNGDNGKR